VALVSARPVLPGNDYSNDTGALSGRRRKRDLDIFVVASNVVSAPLVLLLQPYPLFHDSRARRHAEQEDSLASVNYDDVVAVCAVRIEERPGTIWIDRVGSVGRGFIPPGSDYTAGA
jgi:hypothetical protein